MEAAWPHHDAARAHRGALLALGEALEYARACPPEEYPLALRLLERAERREAEARGAWLREAASFALPARP